MAKILLVEKDHSLRELLSESLEVSGHNVRSASTGEEAVDLCYIFSPDVTISGWDLEGDYDGLEVAAACFHADSNIKNILMAGCAGSFIGCHSQEYIFATLVKPFSLEELLQTVVTAISEKQGSPTCLL